MTNMTKPPATETGGSTEDTTTMVRNHHHSTVGVSGAQSPNSALALFEWLWDDREGLICLATDHRLRDIKSGRKESDFRNARWFNWPADRNKVVEYAEMVMNSREVWFTPAQFMTEDRKKHNTTRGRICQVDLDHTDRWTDEERADNLAFLDKLRAAIVFSGTGANIHAYVKLDRDTPREVIDRLNQRLVARFRFADASKDHGANVLRFPGTLNHKTDPSNPVTLGGVPEGFSGWDPAELARMLPEVQDDPAGGQDEATPWAVPDAPASLGACKTLGDCLSLPPEHDDRSTWAWVQKVAGHESRAEWSKPKPSKREYIARVVSHDAASMAPRLMHDEAQFFEVLEHKWTSDGEKRDSSKTALAAKVASGEMDVVTAVESWDDYDERVFDDLAGWVIRDRAFDLYYGELVALAESDPEAFDKTPYARSELIRQIARARGEEKAKILAAPGNKELGRPSRRSDCAQVVHDVTMPGLLTQPGWVTLFMADYEVGKTMLAYSLAADRLRRGEEVVVIQEDESADQTWGKLDAFCLTADEEDRFQPYNYPGWNLVATPEILDQLMASHPRTTLLVVDSVMKIIKLAGLEEDNPGAVAVWTVFERFIARYPQVAVLLIDHQGHNGSGHARGATGKAQMSSVVAQVQSKAKFARDRDGQIKVTIHKHRNGESTGHVWRGDVIVRHDDQPFRIEWTDEGVKGQAAADELPQPRANGKLTTRDKLVLVFRRRNDEWLSMADLMEATGAARVTVANTLGSMNAESREHPDNPSAKQYRLARSS